MLKKFFVHILEVNFIFIAEATYVIHLKAVDYRYLESPRDHDSGFEITVGLERRG